MMQQIYIIIAKLAYIIFAMWLGVKCLQIKNK